MPIADQFKLIFNASFCSVSANAAVAVVILDDGETFIGGSCEAASVVVNFSQII